MDVVGYCEIDDCEIYCPDCFKGDKKNCHALFDSDECDYQRTCDNCHEPIECQVLRYNYEIFELNTTRDSDDNFEITDSFNTGNEIEIEIHDKKNDILKKLGFRKNFNEFWGNKLAELDGDFMSEEIIVSCSTTGQPFFMLKRI